VTVIASIFASTIIIYIIVKHGNKIGELENIIQQTFPSIKTQAITLALICLIPFVILAISTKIKEHSIAEKVHDEIKVMLKEVRNNKIVYNYLKDNDISDKLSKKYNVHEFTFNGNILPMVKKIAENKDEIKVLSANTNEDIWQLK